MPEGHARRRAGRGNDDDAIVLDGADAPGRRAELERIADAGLVDELLVELSESCLVGEVDGVEAAVGDRAAGDRGDQARSAHRRERVRGAVPRDAGVELRGDVARVLAGEHGERLVEGRAGESVVRVCQAHEVEQLRRGPLRRVRRDTGDDELGEDVERIVDDACGLDVALAHGADDGELLERVVAEGRDEDAAARRGERVTGAADALERRGDALRALELEHDVDGADVDPELERARCDERAQLTRLEALLEHEAPLAREGAVVRLGDVLGGERVDARGDLLRLRAIVDEDERRARVPDLVQHEGRDGGPDRPVDVREVVDRRADLGLHLLHESAVYDFDRAESVRRFTAAKEARDLVERLLRRGETDALWRIGGDAAEALEGEREVRTALGAGDGVDLVDGTERAEHRAAADAREQDVERLRRCDEDVRRLAQHAGAGARRCVAGANGDANLGELLACLLEPFLELRERELEVALDVVVERLERGDVEEMDGVGEWRLQAVGDELVELVEERRERLARAGGSEDERVGAGGDGGPTGALRGARRTEGFGEPGANDRMEGREGVDFGHPRILAGCIEQSAGVSVAP